jgi:hypothetical protein
MTQERSDHVAPRTTTIMARVPAPLAHEVHAYATAHKLSMSALVRAGLVWVLTQTTPPVAPPPEPPPKPRKPRRRAPRLTDRILQVLAAAPEGLTVHDVLMRLSEGPKPYRSRTASVTRLQMVGGTLRALYRAGRLARPAHGVYGPLPPTP